MTITILDYGLRELKGMEREAEKFAEKSICNLLQPCIRVCFFTLTQSHPFIRYIKFAWNKARKQEKKNQTIKERTGFLNLLQQKHDDVVSGQKGPKKDSTKL